jgi:hypothetical protein
VFIETPHQNPSCLCVAVLQFQCDFGLYALIGNSKIRVEWTLLTASTSKS